MSTTELFVELIIIGMGAAIWLFLLIASIFGVAWVDADKLLSLPALIPLLSVIYVLGIVIDRVADTLFERVWGRRLLRNYYENQDRFHEDRRILYLQGERLANLLEYGRSRLRICRGWVLNSVLILLSLNLFTWTSIAEPLRVQVAIVGSLFCLGLIYGTWFSWYKLTLNDFRRVKEQAIFLRQISKSPASLEKPGI
ncbi:MAG: hypothetical protein HC881_16045 [Leptolyngbyaceae cyanobacterium SL_7_1]|nr:hypothetical protein [Leptolyngbyaceae cyanobacterium SL_7_1]